MLGTGTIHVLGWAEQDGMRFHHPTQKGVHFKTYYLFLEFFIYCVWATVDPG